MTRKAGGAAEAMELLLLPLREVVQVLIDARVGCHVSSSSSSSKKSQSTGARKTEDHGRKDEEGGAGVIWKGLCEVKAELDKVAVRAQDAATVGYTPLTLCAVAPVAIAQHNPRFEENFTPEYNMDPDRERAERSKRKRQARKEFKGAVRELRKDNQFLEAEKAQQLKKQRTLRDERAKAIETFLTQQHFEAKLGAGKKNSKGRKRK
jgi:hypothetical protein